MPAGFITANIFDVSAWNLNDPVKVEIVVRKEGDPRPDKFYGLVWEIEKTRLTLARFKDNKERELVHIFIDEINAGEVEVTMLSDPVNPPT